MQIRQTLKRVWGYDQFRPPQEEVVTSLLRGQDALVLLPTGAGKSVCFQLPAILNSGLMLVISPLVSLMENQVQELRQRNVRAALLHHQISAQQRRQTFQRLRQLDLLYLSPESLLSPGVWNKLGDPAVQIRYLVVDEAHCISQWGISFRPIYRRLGAVRTALEQGQSQIVMAAFTATASPVMATEIQAVLQLRTPQVFRVSPYRTNLDLRIKMTCSPASRRHQTLNFIKAQGQSGLIYTRSRRDSEALSQWLSTHQVSSIAYHAGLPSNQRRQIEADWLSGRVQVVVGTSAFGMGINKPNVRWICHLHPPLTLTEYVQEIGRAGRDGLRSQTLLLISEPTGWLDPQDQQLRRYFQQQRRTQKRQAQRLIARLPPRGSLTTLLKSLPQAEIALSMLHGTGQLQWLDPFHFRLVSNPVRARTAVASTLMPLIWTRRCRWQVILDQFGFSEPDFRCGHCDNCRR